MENKEYLFTYGFIGFDIEKARMIIEDLFCIVMQEKYSDFYGGDYFLYRKDKMILRIIYNSDLYDSEPIELNYTDYKVILYLSYVGSLYIYQQKLNNNAYFKLLKSR